MRKQAAAEWAGFVAGLAVAVLAWMWGHTPLGLAADDGQWGMQSTQGLHAEWSGWAANNRQWGMINYQGHAPERSEGETAYGQLETICISGDCAVKDGQETNDEYMRSIPASGILNQQKMIASASFDVPKQRDGAALGSHAAPNPGQNPAAFVPPGSQAVQQLNLPKSVRVYLTKEKRIETVPLETYVRGVVAAEMPAVFHPESMKAQALAARTYIVRRLMKQDRSNVPVPGADVTDSQMHQAYRPLSEMNRLRETDEEAWRKYHQAAYGTAGRIVTYEGEPIQALYFAVSNGHTENSEDVFSHRVPYLRSVDSPWDYEQALRTSETVTIPLKEFYEKLGVRIVPAVAAGRGYPAPEVKEWTQGKRVKTLALGGMLISGTEVRSKLGLRSAAFEWRIEDGQIAITTVGSGHGVGMSQWGAEGMARAGYAAEEIIAHYYPGTELSAGS